MNYESVKLRKDRVERVLGFKMCHIKKKQLCRLLNYGE